MEKVNLCICNNCGSMLIDHNPQVNAQMSEVDTSKYDELIIDNNIKGMEGAWICPNCKTDSYLADL